MEIKWMSFMSTLRFIYWGPNSSFIQNRVEFCEKIL